MKTNLETSNTSKQSEALKLMSFPNSLSYSTLFKVQVNNPLPFPFEIQIDFWHILEMCPLKKII